MRKLTVVALVLFAAAVADAGVVRTVVHTTPAQTGKTVAKATKQVGKKAASGAKKFWHVLY